MLVALRAAAAAAFLVAAYSCAQPSTPAPEPVAPVMTSAQPGDTSLLDRVTTLETLFPNDSDRMLYETKEAATEGGHRTYTFALKPQPGMDPARHFQIATITWMRVEAAAKPAPQNPGAIGTGGPNGSFVERTARTRDNKYDMRVTLGELLPSTVKTASIDLAQVAVRLVDRYATLTSQQP
jgi:hypothetical protein